MRQRSVSRWLWLLVAMFVCEAVSCSSNSGSTSPPPDASGEATAGEGGATAEAATPEGGDAASLALDANDAASIPPDAGDASLAAMTLLPNPNSVLSTFVSFEVPGATVARVTSSSGSDQLTTPYSLVSASGYGQIAVLGLQASTSYAHELQLAGVSDLATSSLTATGTTAALPSELTPLRFTVTPGTGQPQAGYYLISGAGDDAIAVDGTGTLRWYRAFG